jgi:hypothetical protein
MTTDLRKFSQAISTLQLVQTGRWTAPVPQTMYSPARPSGFDWSATLPADSLLFGMAVDGKPLLLSLSNSQPGSILVTAERGSGKTHFLKMLLQAAARLKRPSDAQFAVLTSYPDDFAHIQASQHLLGVWASYDEPATSDMLYQLACRVEDAKNRQPIILLVDGLDAIFQLDQQSQDNLVYILANGPEAMVWPVVTANADMIVDLPDWLDCFRTRIYGRVSNPTTAAMLSTLPGAPLNSLLPGTQFCLREKSQWLKFWLPTLPA